ncbi:YitT family protein [Cohnella terricola]|uniref:YitT family protein n=2 Tax=Cohnella terricola TaxID=1289167 RepID=A0A559J525_9BACL|nr:YitT family protein [Cohnella terricola]TVX94998.1 YitT family protein [Cohnella terricola]
MTDATTSLGPPGAPAAIRHHKQTPWEIARRIIFIMIGAVLVGVALEIFLVNNSIIDGGVTGISIMSSYLSGLPIGIFLFVLNLPFLILGYRTIGKTFALSTLFGVIVLSISTTLLHPIEPFTENTFLAAVFGGIFLGAGTGIVIRAGGSLDGTEIVAILLNRKSPFSVGQVVMFINLFILGSAGFVYSWDRAMYSMIAYYIAFKVIDLTIEGFDESKSCWIISDQHKEIGDAITARLGRGVTFLHGEGGYTGDQKKVIFCVINRLEEAKLKTIVTELDPGAFLAVGNIHDVKGGRFKKKDIH